MRLFHRCYWTGLLLLAVSLAPAGACGPFLYGNTELEQFSLLDPGILNSSRWNSFLAFSSPAIGHVHSDDRPVQYVIRPDRLPLTSEGASNLVYDYDPGQDPLSVAANEAWWADYFKAVRQRTVHNNQVAALLYEGSRPAWLNPADRRYLDLLDLPPDDPQARAQAETQARNRALPEGLRHRYAFWLIRAAALDGDPRTMTLFREFSPGPAVDLPLARAQGWAASVLAETDPEGALALWVDLLVRWPALGAQAFSSLATLGTDAWEGQVAPAALMARFFLDGRDFSPETLTALATAERAAGGDGTWTETVFYAMAEQIEAESGVFALFGLVDPHEVPPKGLFTGLLDGAEALAAQGLQPATRTWWLLAAYVSLFDGDAGRAAEFLGRARSFPPRNPAQEAQTGLLAALVQMDAERERDWSAALQRQVVQSLDWAKTLDAPGHNRGLYHSLVVLAAQKYLARGQNAQAALTFGLIQEGPWSNPYRLRTDDWFWATTWTGNNSVNLLFDALLSDTDLEDWQALLKARNLEPLTARVAAHPFLTTRDLTWWQAHRALRRGEGETARALLTSLGGGSGSAFFPRRNFAYSLDLDPLDPVSGRGMRTVTPLQLAEEMVRIETQARNSPSPSTLLARGEFWLSLQLSGLPLLFAQPPETISFVNGNWEYYGYDGRDLERTTSVVGEFPLGRPARTEDWALTLEAFYRDEFTTLGRAREAFEAVVALGVDPEAEYQALLFLQTIDGNRFADLGDSRYDEVPLAQEFRATCEAFW